MSENENEDGSEESGAIVVIDPDPDSRQAAEGLEEAVARSVIAIDSVEFGSELADDVLEAETYLICWDLGIRSGADLLEMIRQDPRFEDKKVIVAMAGPTRERARWAMSLGADALCSLPYDADELVARVATLEARG
jgi:DNA-binding NarL/FixJ family response regulator